jgi:hypothetical protein
MYPHQHDGERPAGLGRTLIKVTVPATVSPGHFVPDGGSPGISHSVWLPPAGGPGAPAANETELPTWALARIAAQFLPNGGELGISHGPGPGRTDLSVIPTEWAPEWMNAAQVRHGAEPIPALDAALVIGDPLEYEPTAPFEVAVPYFRVLREAVGPGGVVLVHTHQATDLAGMLDPSGLCVQQAKLAGLGYLQHFVIVHTRLLTEPLSVCDDVPRNPPRHAKIRPQHRRVHSDLLAFLA